MKNLKKNIIYLSICISFFIIQSVKAQNEKIVNDPSPPPFSSNAFGGSSDLETDNIGGSTSELTDPDNGLPIDGGLGFLLAAGLGYGVNKLRKKNKDSFKN